MTNTKALGRHFQDEYAILQSNDEFKREGTLIGHINVHNYIQFLGFRATLPKKTFTKSEKDDISGYFEYLIRNFHTISAFIRKSAKSPKRFCDVEFALDGWTCRTALSQMLNKKVVEIEKMEADEALNYCYLNYTHHDFTYDKIFSESGYYLRSSTSLSRQEERVRQLVLDVMNSYFRHMMDIAHFIHVENMADSAESSGNEHRYASPDEGSAYLNPECIDNVKLVFNDCEDCPLNIDKRGLNNIYTRPFFAFRFAMFSLSEKFIKSMTNTKKLGLHFRNEYYEVLQSNDEFKRRGTLTGHKNFHDYIRFLGFRTTLPNKTFTESEKDEIYGYFKYLIRNFHTISAFIQKSAKSPKLFCEVEFAQHEWICRTALSQMLNKKVAEIEKMEADEALNYCYLNYTHHDFTYDKIFSSLASLCSCTSISSEEETFRQLTLDVMNSYFRHLMDIAHWIGLKNMEITSTLFPTIEEYCEGSDSN